MTTVSEILKWLTRSFEVYQYWSNVATNCYLDTIPDYYSIQCQELINALRKLDKKPDCRGNEDAARRAFSEKLSEHFSHYEDGMPDISQAPSDWKVMVMNYFFMPVTGITDELTRRNQSRLRINQQPLQWQEIAFNKTGSAGLYNQFLFSDVMDFVALDFETASSNKDEQFICSYGLAKYVAGEKVDELYSLVKPPYGIISPYNASIHGIREDMVADEEEFDVHYHRILDFIGNLPLVAHSAKAADITFLKSTLRYYNLDFPANKWYCSCCLAKLFLQGEKRYTLDALCHKLSIDLDNHHNALSDAIATGEIFLKLYNGLGENLIRQSSIDIDSVDDSEECAPIETCSRTTHNARYFSNPYQHEEDKFDFDNLVLNNSLNGLTVCCTGRISEASRNDVISIIEILGGTFSKGITKKVDILIQGINEQGTPSTRNQKAQEYQIPILSWDEFKKKFISFKKE